MKSFLKAASAAVAICLAGAIHAGDKERTFAPPSSTEIIEELSKGTDVSTDSLALLMKEKPALFDNLKDIMTASKVVDMLFDAKDADAATEVISWQFNKGVDALLEKVVPAPALSFISAVKAYKSALELLRDHVVIPAFDEKMYAFYKKQRAESGASTDDAFTETTVQRNSGYYLVKTKMADQVIKSKGWNKDLVGDKLMKEAERQIDKFWNSRLEARYQQELCKAQATEIQAKLKEMKAKAMAGIAAAAPKPVAAKKAEAAAPKPSAKPAQAAQDAQKAQVAAKPQGKPDAAKAPATPSKKPEPKKVAASDVLLSVPAEIPKGWFYVNVNGENGGPITDSGKIDEEYYGGGDLQPTGGTVLGVQDFYVSKDAGFVWNEKERELTHPNGVQARFNEITLRIVEFPNAELAKKKIAYYAKSIFPKATQVTDSSAMSRDSEGITSIYMKGNFVIYLCISQRFPSFGPDNGLFSDVKTAIDKKLDAALKQR